MGGDDGYVACVYDTEAFFSLLEAMGQNVTRRNVQCGDPIA